MQPQVYSRGFGHWKSVSRAEKLFCDTQRQATAAARSHGTNRPSWMQDTVVMVCKCVALAVLVEQSQLKMYPSVRSSSHCLPALQHATARVITAHGRKLRSSWCVCAVQLPFLLNTRSANCTQQLSAPPANAPRQPHTSLPPRNTKLDMSYSVWTIIGADRAVRGKNSEKGSTIVTLLHRYKGKPPDYNILVIFNKRRIQQRVNDRQRG